MSDIPQNSARKILRIPQVKNTINLSKSMIYSMMDPKSSSYDPNFPHQVRLGPRAVGWYEDEVQGWLASRGGDNNPSPQKPASGGSSIAIQEVASSTAGENSYRHSELDDVRNRRLSTVRLMLERQAKIGQHVFYAEVMKEIMLSPDSPDDCKVMNSILEEISTASHAERQLLLGVMVHEKPGLATEPNQAFFDLATSLGYACEDRRGFVMKHIVALYESFEDPSRKTNGKIIRVSFRGQSRLVRSRKN